MQTKRIKVYSFDELSETAQQQAIENARRTDNIQQCDFIYDEAHQTVKAFNDLFNVTEGRREWTDFSTGQIDGDILNLSGTRLATYLWNNYRNDLYKGKYYPVKSDTPLRHKRVKSKTLHNGRTFNAYYSAIQFENSCVLTGMCYDMDILDPIYKFIDKPDGRTFEDLISECFSSLKYSLESEQDYHYSDEGVQEYLTANNYQFLKDGTIFIY